MTNELAVSVSDRTHPPDGVFYHGRPDWMSMELLETLLVEAEMLRKDALLLRRQFHAAGGPVAQKFARSPEMLDLIQEHAGPAVASGPANYLYYERENDGIDPHIDDGNFEINLLMLLRHQYTDRRQSALVLFPRGPKHARWFFLEPGELVLFHSTGVVHARSNVAGDEQVVNLGIGYEAKFSLCDISRYWRP